MVKLDLANGDTISLVTFTIIRAIIGDLVSIKNKHKVHAYSYDYDTARKNADYIFQVLKLEGVDKYFDYEITDNTNYLVDSSYTLCKWELIVWLKEEYYDKLDQIMTILRINGRLTL